LGDARMPESGHTTQRINSDDYDKWGKVIAAAGIKPE
jgi:hypothetical protein